jgi:hypothetical protein
MKKKRNTPLLFPLRNLFRDGPHGWMLDMTSRSVRIIPRRNLYREILGLVVRTRADGMER